MTAMRRDVIFVSGSAYHLVNRFMNELRTVPYLDSKVNHFIAMDIDGVIRNYGTDKMIFIESKCRLAMPTFPEQTMLDFINKTMCLNPNFMGVFLVQHQRETLDDGYMKLSILRSGEWKPILSGSTDQLNKDNVFKFVKNILT